MVALRGDGWELAPSLLKLLQQVDEHLPKRNKGDDGTIGNEEHQSRNSEHNPSDGYVRALDLTHDPAGGFNSYEFADTLKRNADGRIYYVISNRRIWTPSKSPNWRAYTGVNDHTRHAHISVRGPGKMEAWDLSGYDWEPRKGTLPTGEPVVVLPRRPILRKGSKGEGVRLVQNKLGITADAKFGIETELAVMKFQKENELVPDGIVGGATWEKLLS